MYDDSSLYKSGGEMNPLHQAVQKGDVKEAERFLHKHPNSVHSLNWQDNTPLFVAATVEIARLLIAYGANVNAQGYRDRTPLYEAAYRDRLDVARFLLQNGADANAGINANSTPLWEAHSAVMAQLLIDHGARLEVVYQSDWPPIFTATQHGSRGLVELLIRRGEDVNATAGRSEAPLNLALERGDFEIAKRLIEAGADINATTSYNGNTPLHLIMKHGSNYGTSENTEEDTLPARKEEEKATPAKIIRMLMDRGADLCARNQGGATPLHIAIENQATGLLEVLQPYLAQINDPFPPLPGPPQSVRICLHPTRQEAVTILRYGGLARWSLETDPRLLARIQTSYAHFSLLDVSPEGDQIAVTTGDTFELRRWDDLSIISKISLSDYKSFRNFAFSPDGCWLAIEKNDGVSLIERATGKRIIEIEEIGLGRWISFDPSSRLLICGGCSNRGDERVAIYRLSSDATAATRIWDDSELDSEGPDEYWQPLFLVHAAFSPDCRWLAYFGTDEYPHGNQWLGQLVLHSLDSGGLEWHTEIDGEIFYEERLEARDYFGHHSEVLFLSEREIVCGLTRGTLLCFDVATGELTRRFYFDTEEDVLSLALDRASSTIWATLSNGELAHINIDVNMQRATLTDDDK